MKFEQLFSRNRVLFEYELTKHELIKKMCVAFFEDGIVSNLEQFELDIYKREEEYSTYVGHGIAIPHAISKQVKEAGICFLKLEHNLSYGEREEDVRLVFMLAIPENSSENHLRILSSLAKNLMKEDFRKLLEYSNGIDDFYRAIKTIQ